MLGFAVMNAEETVTTIIWTGKVIGYVPVLIVQIKRLIFMTKNTLVEDLEMMEAVLDKTATRVDLWQDRCIYWMAVCIWHILQHIRSRGL